MYVIVKRMRMRMRMRSNNTHELSSNARTYAHSNVPKPKQAICSKSPPPLLSSACIPFLRFTTARKHSMAVSGSVRLPTSNGDCASSALDVLMNPAYAYRHQDASPVRAFVAQTTR